MSNLQSIKDATLVKEKEWRELLELSVGRLETELKSTQDILEDERAKFLELKKDFKHNFCLLQEKEQICEGLKAKVGNLEEANRKLESDFCDISSTNEKLRSQLDQERASFEEIKAFYKESLERKSKEYDSSKHEMVAYYQNEVDSLNLSRNKLLKDLAVCEESCSSKLEKLTSEYEIKIQEMKAALSEERNSLEQKLFTLELEKDLLLKDMQTLTAAANSLQVELDEKENSINELRQSHQRMSSKLKDFEAVHQAHLKQSKFELSEKSERFSQLETKLKTKIKELEQQLSLSLKSNQELRETQDSLNKNLSEEKRVHNSNVQLKEEELFRLKSRLESEIQQLNSANEKALEDKRKVQQELELAVLEKDRVSRLLKDEGHNCKEKLDRMKYDLDVKNKDLERYRSELAVSLENIRSLQSEMEQRDLDWSRKCELIEASSYEKSEVLVKTLTEHRSKMSVEISELKRALNAKTHLVSLLKKERDCSVLTLRRHNLAVDFDVPIKESQVESEGLRSFEFEKLADQNESLREVIRKMKDEMELFTKEAESKHQAEVRAFSSNVEKLEKELADKCSALVQIGKKNQQLEEQLNFTKAASKNEDKEKMSSTTDETDQKLSEIQYQFMALKRRTDSEIKHLKQELESSDQHIRGLQKDKKELLVRLKEQIGPDSLPDKYEAKLIVELNAKLKAAASHISFLAKERQRLIGLCNKLRATSDMPKTRQVVEEKPQSSRKSKLEEIQHMQYQIARRQLAENWEYSEGAANKELIVSRDNERPKRIASPVSTSSPSASVNVDGLKSTGFHEQVHPERMRESSASDSEDVAESRRSGKLPVDVMSSIGAEDSTLQNIMRMVDKGPESFTPMMSLNSTDGQPASTNQVSSAQNQDVQTGKSRFGTNAKLEVVGKAEHISADREPKQPEFSAKALGKIAPSETRKRTVRNYNQKDER